MSIKKLQGSNFWKSKKKRERNDGNKINQAKTLDLEIKEIWVPGN